VYFLDDMSMRAIELAFQGYDKKRQDSWEQTRNIAYYVARPNLKGNPSMRSFMPLQWDKKTVSKKSTRERFKQLESKLTKIINHGKR
jgi:hypothetical protein